MEEGEAIVFAKEDNAERAEHFEYLLRDSTVQRRARGQRQSRRRLGFFKWLSRVFRAVFLPAGYPQSVSADYAQYQVWDTVQATCSTLTGLLATRSVLVGLGVGDESADAASATLQWAVRDISGKAGGVAFAWLRGAALDRDAKHWRLAADVINDAAFLVELLSPLAPARLFLPLASLACILRAVVGVAGSGTRASVTAHQARAGNTADVAAKDGSQETAVNIAGLLLGIALLRLLRTAPDALQTVLAFAAVSVLIAGHLAANHQAVRSLVLDTVNDQRCAIIAEHFRATSSVPTPAIVAQRESVWHWSQGNVARVALGVPLSEVLSDGPPPTAVPKPFGDEPYIIEAHSGSGGNCVKVVLLSASADAVLLAAFHAHLVRALVLGGTHDPCTNATVAKARAMLKAPSSVLALLAGAGWDATRPLVSLEGSVVRLSH